MKLMAQSIGIRGAWFAVEDLLQFLTEIPHGGKWRLPVGMIREVQSIIFRRFDLWE